MLYCDFLKEMHTAALIFVKTQKAFNFSTFRSLAVVKLTLFIHRAANKTGIKEKKNEKALSIESNC